MENRFKPHFYFMLSPFVVFIAALIASIFLLSSCGSNKTTVKKTEEETQKTEEITAATTTTVKTLEISKDQEKKITVFDIEKITASLAENFNLTPVDPTKPAKFYSVGDTIVIENANLNTTSTSNIKKEKNNSTQSKETASENSLEEECETTTETGSKTEETTKKSSKEKDKRKSGFRLGFWGWFSVVVAAIVFLVWLFLKLKKTFWI